MGVIKETIKKVRSVLMYPIYLCYKSSVPVSTYIRKGTIPRRSTIGKFCWINTNVGLNCVDMGNYCSIASQVLIGGMEHPIDKCSTSTLLNEAVVLKSKKTVIGHNVWIGAQCVIKQGVRIENGAVIGANSFVNKNVPPYAIVAGSPAKIIKFRFDKDVIEKIERSNFWNYPPKKAKEIINSIQQDWSIQ